MEQNNIISRFAEIQQISYEEADQLIGAATNDEIIKNIENFIIEDVSQKNNFKLNRKQRRALAKKQKNKNLKNEAEVITETAKKINYIDLIQRLRKLNEIKENENYEGTTENN